MLSFINAKTLTIDEMHLSNHEVISLLKVPSPFSTAVHNEVISLHLQPERRLIIYGTDNSKWILNNQEIRAILDRYWEATLAHNLERECMNFIMMRL
jgi:hypothetical protein